jgi:hypothetical protein
MRGSFDLPSIPASLSSDEFRRLRDAGAQDAERRTSALAPDSLTSNAVSDLGKPSASGVSVSQFRNSRPHGLPSTVRIVFFAL